MRADIEYEHYTNRTDTAGDTQIGSAIHDDEDTTGISSALVAIKEPSLR
jgi:hypothetical protein